MEEKKVMKLAVGDKYLTVELDLGVLGKHKASAFKNEKTKEGSPDFKGKGIAVWVNKKRAESSRTVKEEDI